MGLFDNSSSKSDEVRIGVSEQESDSKLKNEVETRITGDEDSSKSSFDSGSSDVDLEDIHEQNKRIIKLLESIADEDVGQAENDTQEGMRGGMDELL